MYLPGRVMFIFGLVAVASGSKYNETCPGIAMTPVHSERNENRRKSLVVEEEQAKVDIATRVMCTADAA